MSLPVDPHLYGLFLGVMAVMAITPGPANVFAIASGVQRGPRDALVSVAGMNAATLVWFAAAALGLAALVRSFPDAFRLLAVAGGLYVAWLGLKALWAGARDDVGDGAALGRARVGTSPFLDGFAVQIANPKAVLFFTAVLPPFIDPARPAPAQLAAFAVATIGADVIAMSSYALAGAALTQRFERPAFRRGFSLLVGCLLLTASALILLRR
ncbi:MAG: LysE family translocator [Hyphomonadaceae bacterium]|nr:LysE family translocator [Hyphomonadaceae bacterium]